MSKLRKILIIVGSVVLILILGLFITAKIVLRDKYVVPILMYHHVDDNWQKSKLSVSPQSFKKQMEFLKKKNYNVMLLSALIDAVKQGEELAPKTVAITFDDGYEDNYLNAFPVLDELQIPATMFIALNSLGTEGFMSWEQIKDLSDSKVIDIGSHTLNHAWLRSQDDALLTKEIFESKEILEQKTGREIKVFSYPLGAFDEKVQKMVKLAGYTGACATNPEIDFKDPDKKYDPYAMARCRISRTSDNLIVFRIEISGYYSWIKSVRDEK